MKQFLMQQLRNKDVWTGFAIGVVFTICAAYGLNVELAQNAIEAMVEIINTP